MASQPSNTDLTDLSLWYKARQDQVTVAAQQWGRRAWANLDPAQPATWARSIPGIVAMTQAAMVTSATGADGYVDRAAALQGDAAVSDYEIDPYGFADSAADGRALGSLLYTPALTVQAQLDVGATDTQAWDAGLTDLLTILGTEVPDAGRQAVNAAMVADDRVTGYYRQPGPAACSRCAVLAGKWYSSYEAATFQRHPRCQCTAVPADRGDGRNPVAKSPRDYFNALSTVQQDRAYTVAGAQAIRDGADITQVVNARQGVTDIGSWHGTSGTGWTTSVGATKSAWYGGYTPAGLAGKPRLTTEAIYRLSSSREEAVSMLREYGYLR